MIRVEQHRALTEVPAAPWDALVPADYPFARHAFLSGLEQHDCLEAHGWQPLHLTAWQGEHLAGAMPLYLKTNSIGEFVFDWAWADAFERAGGRYYPKLVSAIPFAPVTGPRLLLDRAAPAAGAVAEALVGAAIECVRELELSSLHCLFPDEPDRQRLAEAELLLRSGCQYHWFNRGHADFEAFLASLNAKRRKQIRRERRGVREQGVAIERLQGEEITDEQWRVFHRFYCATFHKRWGEPRLTLPFFRSLSRELPRSTLLWLASQDGEYVAGAFALRGDRTLYGRHWGCSREIEFLHFELCYYRTIDYAIEQGLERLDAGAQGEHKVMRGFEAVKTWSGHWIAHPGLREAVARFLDAEGRQVDGYVRAVAAHVPYRKDPESQ